MEFLINNLGTIIVALVLVGIVALILYKMKKDKKQGKSSCGCSCGCCPNSQYCHGKVDNSQLTTDNQIAL